MKENEAIRGLPKELQEFIDAIYKEHYMILEGFRAYPSLGTPSTPERHTGHPGGKQEGFSAHPHPLEISHTKVRPSEVDNKVCKGILDEISEASPDREWVWRIPCASAYIPITHLHLRHKGCVYPTKEDAAGAGSIVERYDADEPIMCELGTVLAEAKRLGVGTIILCDANLNVLKEWVIP